MTPDEPTPEEAAALADPALGFKVILGAMVKALREEPDDVYSRVYERTVALMREVQASDPERWTPILLPIALKWMEYRRSTPGEAP